MPLRLRIRGSHRRCHIEWDVLETLVRLARQSDLEVEVEYLTAGGTSVMMTLVS